MTWPDARAIFALATGYSAWRQRRKEFVRARRGAWSRTQGARAAEMAAWERRHPCPCLALAFGRYPFSPVWSADLDGERRVITRPLWAAGRVAVPSEWIPAWEQVWRWQDTGDLLPEDAQWACRLPCGPTPDDARAPFAYQPVSGPRRTVSGIDRGEQTAETATSIAAPDGQPASHPLDEDFDVWST